MKVECYLRVKAKKSNYARDIENPDYFKSTELKISRNKPDTAADEIAVKLELDIPNSLFVKPTLNFKMTIPEAAVSLPVLEAEAQENLAELLQEQLGQRIHLSVSADSEAVGASSE